MKNLFLIPLMLLIFSASAMAQAQLKPAGLSTFTLTSPYAEDGHGKLKQSEKADRNCFDFVTESEVPCIKRWDIVYGNMRAGEEWDWFFVPASDRETRSRMVRASA